jgi:aminomethyltransferase
VAANRIDGVREALARHGAVFEGGDARHALHFGDPEADYRALASGCGWVVRTWSSRLLLTGADRIRFLNGMTTCDVAALAPGDGAYGFFTSAKGRILADAVVRAGDDSLELELPEEAASGIEQHLRRYVVADRVEIERPGDRVLVELAGPGAAALLERESGREPPSGWGAARVELFGVPLMLAAGGRFGVDAYTAWIDPDDLERLLAAVRGHTARPVPIGLAAWETVRVENGALLFGRDFGPDNLPQETGLEEAVSYTKGCYIGQEVVARLHYRGQPQRGPRGLAIAGETMPERGAEIRFEGRAAGRLTSVVRSPARGGPFGLALLHRRAAEAGSVVEIEGAGEATVIAL